MAKQKIIEKYNIIGVVDVIGENDDRDFNALKLYFDAPLNSDLNKQWIVFKENGKMLGWEFSKMELEKIGLNENKAKEIYKEIKETGIEFDLKSYY